ncbi:MAG: ABC transporter substrate-binding protein [Polyangiales bacterium]
MRLLTSRLLSLFFAIAFGLATTSMLAAPLQAEAGATEIVFASGPDGTGTVQRLIDAFNESNRGAIHVTWRQMDRENNAHRRQLVKALSFKKGGIDLIATDVIWTAEFAKKKWVEDLTKRFYEAYDRESFLSSALGSATYRLRIWGVPWYTDAGLLFYRKDKLAKSGFSAPPATWEELARMARKVMEDTGTRHGFVFQGAEYEGGTVNAAEFIWSAGGELMVGQVTATGTVLPGVAETDAVLVGSDAAARGLDIARKLVADKVSPEAVASFREKEALDAFVSGDAVFLRSWPYVYASLRQAGFTLDQLGIAPLPAASTGGRSASCLGGWNLMINASSSKSERDAAWKLIRYLTSAPQQKRQAREAGVLPILRALYDDADLVKQVPVMALGNEVLTSQLHARPMSPFYSEVSAKVARAFNQTLKGELTGAEAAQRLDKELRAIVRRNR